VKAGVENIHIIFQENGNYAVYLFFAAYACRLMMMTAHTVKSTRRSEFNEMSRNEKKTEIFFQSDITVEGKENITFSTFFHPSPGTKV